MSHFYSDEEAVLKRLLVLRHMVAEQKLHGSPCPLMLSQLNSLQVFAEAMVSEVRKLRTAVEKHEAIAKRGDPS